MRRALPFAISISLLAPRVAVAQDQASDTATARSLGVEGFKLAAGGNCKDAIDRLTRSESLHHAVTVLEKLGECQVKVGKIVDGTESLRRVLREPLAADAPPAYFAAREAAQHELDGAARRVAHARILVTAPPTAVVWVRIDGAPMSTASLNAERVVDPGDHVIEAGAVGFLTASTTVHSKEGGSEQVALALLPDPNAQVVAPLPPPVALPAPIAQPEATPPAAPPPRSHTLAYVVGGVGLGGLAVGVGAGIAALVDKGNLSSACPGNVCPASSSSTLNAGKTAGTVSTVGFIAGGVLVGAGVGLYFVNFGGSEGRPVARAYVGPGSVGLNGSF